ncbi:MAG: hypothetical protein KF842_06065 [Caulobacter sp.]|nr:hypothetical protein [Caulobacter sp.]
MRNLLPMLIAAGTTLAITTLFRRSIDEAVAEPEPVRPQATIPPPMANTMPLPSASDSLAAANRAGPSGVN